MKNKKQGWLVLGIIFLPLLLILFSYQTTLFFTHLNPAQEETINFLKNKGELRLDYGDLEKAHLEDVNVVMQWVEYLFYGLLLILTLIITSVRRDKELLKKMFYYGGLSTVVILILVLVLSTFFFTELFTLFHLIFFPQGNWIFPVDSLLIQTFPEEFFVRLSRMIFIQTLVYGSLFILIPLFWNYVPCHQRV